MAAYIAITVESRGGKETIGCGTMGGRCVPRETRGSDDTIGSAAMAGVGGGALCRWSTAAKRLFTVAPCWSVAHRSNPALPRGRVAVG